MTDDAELLRRYAAEKSEAAFAELVQRHLGLVYHTALRHLHGQPSGAEDVAQVVFADLAARAATLSRHPLLAGWLHHRTRYAAWNHLRAERRRQAREQAAHLMEEITRESEPVIDWARLRPVIDDALQALRPGDREAILLRFFEGRGFAEVGTRLQLTEDGARARVDRALEKMQAYLSRRGVTSAGGALSVALAQNASALAPAGLAASVTTAVLTGATAASTGSALALSALSLMKVTTVLLTGSLAANAVLGALYVRDTSAAPPPVATATASATANAAADPVVDILTTAYTSDPATLLARLRAANIPEHIRRALIEAALDEQFRAREEALLPKKAAVGWWQWQDDRLPVKTNLALLDLRREKEKLRLQLLGPDPAALATDDADDPIPPAKRPMLKLIAEDYGAMFASLRVTGPLLPAEREQLQLVEDQRKKDLAALLTPEELAAYDERTWSGLSNLREQIRYANMSGSEFADYKASYLRNDAEMKKDGLTQGEEEKELDLLYDTWGKARFEEFERSQRIEFRDLQSLLERSGRPLRDAAPVYALFQNIEPESLSIAARTDLTAQQKRDALGQLANRTREGIRAALGNEIGDAFIKRAMWLSALDSGSTVKISPDGFGGSSVMMPPGPPPPTRVPQYTRQRPAP